jgi:hypothetical protein
MPKGERVRAQSKRTAPPPISKILVFQRVLSNWYLTYDIISNWHTLFKINIKTLLNTKRRISLRGEFCSVEGKAFETGGENFKS